MPGSRVQPERLAHHWTDAGVAAKAMECWRRAGRRPRALDEPRGGREPQKGLGLLPALPEGLERKAAELDLCIGLGVARSSADWAGAPAAGEAFERACALSEEIGDVPEAFSALWGLWRHRRTCRDFTAARGIADRLSVIATEHGDSGLVLQAGHAQWSTALNFGDWAGCLEHCNSGVALYDQRQHHAQVFRFGSHDPCTCGHATAAISLTVLGELEQAALRLDEAVRIARALNHPETLVQTLGVNIHLLRREVDLAVERGAMALEVTREYEFAEVYPTSSFVECWRAVRAGDVQAGVARAREGLAARRAAGINEEAHALVNYVDLLAGAGEAEEGLAVIAGLRADLEGTGVRHMDAELARLTGVLLQRLRGDADREAEACLEDAIGIARDQGARLFELRAAMDLARLREAQGRLRNGREILSPIAGSFAEQSASEDVRQARALLAELA